MSDQSKAAGEKPSDASDDGPVMPPSMSMPADAPPPPAVAAKPLSFGRQMVQLVVIPAVIVVVCVGVVALLSVLIVVPDSIDSYLLKLRASSGVGRLPGGFQDPRYKDKALAAYNLAQMIPSIEDPTQRQRISRELIDILDHNVDEQEDNLQFYLLMAIGQLGREGGLDAILARFDSDRPMVLEGAIGAVLSWPDPDNARRAIPQLVAVLGSASSVVRKEAAAALGALARPDDPGVIEALREAMTSVGSGMREVRWNAAVAAARLGDERASHRVAELLLNRQALATLPAAESGPDAQRTMSQPMQDQIMMSVLAAARTMTHPVVRDKIRQIADNDPSLAVKSAAKQVIHTWDQGAP
ncbi:MAG: HEAT repeat domain-containing protein [Phycisphaeraceae bacterium]